MTTTTPPAPTYRSGWCGTAQHDTCRGTYAGVSCACACHAPPPLDQPLPVVQLVTCPRCKHGFGVPLRTDGEVRRG